MKLSQQYIRFYMYVTAIVFLFSIIASYFGFKLVVIKNLDFSLSEEKIELIEEFRAGVSFQKHGQYVDIEKIALAPKDMKDRYTTVQVFDKEQKQIVNLRELTTYIYKNSELYQIKIRLHLDPLINNIFSILPYFLVSFVVLVICLYVVNSFFLRKLFLPFYQILDSLKKYDIQKGDYRTDIKSGVYEFVELDNIAANLTDRVHKDYKIQKEFIENSSHEFKTPLAIINNQLDLLIQSENLGEKDMQHIDKIYDAIKRLHNLNKNLTFLFKIENQHFTDNTIADFNEELDLILSANSDLYQDKNITLSKFVSGEVKLKMNKTLVEVLLNNLINNAYKYAMPKSNISIRLTSSSFEITNVADKDKVSDVNLYNRFVTSGDMTSTGLGLSIVKKICDVYKIEITCTVFEELFSVYLEFPVEEIIEFE